MKNQYLANMEVYHLKNDRQQLINTIAEKRKARSNFKNMKRLLFIGLGTLLALSSCKNNEWDFPDYDYKAVYFAYQSPIRTITFGDDIFDTTLDNQGKFKLMGTLAGAYTSKENITIDIEIDNDLCKGIKYPTNQGGKDVVPLPENYYILSSQQIVIPRGEVMGGVEVQLTDAFFADPLSKSINYVLPVKMTKVVNADTILSGRAVAGINKPHPAIADHWESNMAPKNFTLFAVKYMNTWHGHYLRRGKDEITGKNGNTQLTKSVVRHQSDVEKDEVKSLGTESKQTATLPLTFSGVGGVNVQANLLLTFDGNNNCTITASNSTFTATGTGKFIKKGEKQSFGKQDRDALYLEYDIELANMRISSKDTLVMRNRGNTLETFTPTLK